MTRTATPRWLFLALAALTLASQVAVASHIPALDDQPVSTCHDESNHVCADGAIHDKGPCVLCQASSGGVAFALAVPLESFLIPKPVSPVEEAGPRSTLTFSSAAPRAPPALPA